MTYGMVTTSITKKANLSLFCLCTSITFAMCCLTRLCPLCVCRVYDVLGQAWACYVPRVGSALALAHLAPAPRSGAVCGVIDSEFYVIGGFSQVIAKAKAPKKRLEEDDDDDRNGIAHQDIWKINLDKLEEGWTKVKIGTDIMPAKRSSATGVFLFLLFFFFSFFSFLFSSFLFSSLLFSSLLFSSLLFSLSLSFFIFIYLFYFFTFSF